MGSFLWGKPPHTDVGSSPSWEFFDSVGDTNCTLYWCHGSSSSLQGSKAIIIILIITTITIIFLLQCTINLNACTL